MYQYDSRQIQAGDTFICLQGGEAYIEEAKKRGAKDILHLSRKEMGKLASEYYQNPSKKLSVIGITGTNGKSSICHFVTQVLNNLGHSAYVQGTLTHRLTTPESLDTIREMKHHLDNGGSHFIMEVSSHGIDQDRHSGIHFDICCLTNISRDHLDYHRTFEHYKQSKLRFMKQQQGHAIYPSELLNCPSINNANISGNFNQKNLKMAYLILKQLGINEHDIMKELSIIKGADGRFEEISSKAPFRVFIDYAHSPDGLRVVLEAGKQLTINDSKLRCCFGCGGDRDKGKREKMGRIASELSDTIVLTQDNPRTESPEQIVADIQKGIDHNHVLLEHDRHKAIRLLLQHAKKDDILIIAGKGHEDYQIIGDTSHPFSDKETTQDLLREMGY